MLVLPIAFYQFIVQVFVTGLQNSITYDILISVRIGSWIF